MQPAIKKFAITSSFLLAIILAVAFLALFPGIKKLQNDKSELSQTKALIESNNKKIASFETVNKNANSFSQTKTTVSNYWPDNVDVSQFIVQTENLAKDNNLILENFSIEQVKEEKVDSKASSSTQNATNNDKKKKKGPPSVLFTFTSKSAYGSIVNLIEGMENLGRLNSIGYLSLTSEDGNQINLRLTGNVYYGK